jgi:spore coat protein CotH
MTDRTQVNVQGPDRGRRGPSIGGGLAVALVILGGATVAGSLAHAQDAARQVPGAAPPAGVVPQPAPGGGALQPAPGAAPPGPFQVREERKVVRQFDADGNGRLDLAERKAARAWLADQPPTGMAARFGRGPGGLGAIRAGRGYAPSSPGRRLVPADVRPAGTAPLYDTGTLRTIFLEFESPDWEKELEAFYSTDVDVPAAMTVDGAVYRDVGVHFRGASSFLFVPEGSKRSLNLSVDFVHEGQHLLGYRTLNLLNVNSDPTYTRPLLYAEIARHYLPTPKTNYVHVVINGESWGVYVNTQQFNADFLREWFPSTRGARWKVPGSPFGQGGMRYLGDDPEAYKKIYEIKTRDDRKSWAALINVFKVLTGTPLDRLEAALAPILDVDRALRFLALEIALVNTDGYWTRASDYNLYLDEKGRLHVLPHDVNEAIEEEGFGPGRGGGRGGPGPVGPGPGRGGPPPGALPGPPPPGAPPAPAGPGAPAAAGTPGGQPPGSAPAPAGPPPGLPPFPATFGRARVDLDPLIGLDDASKPLRSRLLAVPALRERYLAYVKEIAEKWLDWKTLEPLVRQYQALIADEVKADTRKLYSFERFQSDVAEGQQSLKSFVDRRRAFLLKGQ